MRHGHARFFRSFGRELKLNEAVSAKTMIGRGRIFAAYETPFYPRSYGLDVFGYFGYCMIWALLPSGAPNGALWAIPYAETRYAYVFCPSPSHVGEDPFEPTPGDTVTWLRSAGCTILQTNAVLSFGDLNGGTIYYIDFTKAEEVDVVSSSDETTSSDDEATSSNDAAPRRVAG